MATHEMNIAHSVIHWFGTYSDECLVQPRLAASVLSPVIVADSDNESAVVVRYYRSKRRGSVEL